MNTAMQCLTSSKAGGAGLNPESPARQKGPAWSAQRVIECDNRKKSRTRRGEIVGLGVSVTPYGLSHPEGVYQEKTIRRFFGTFLLQLKVQCTRICRERLLRTAKSESQINEREPLSVTVQSHYVLLPVRRGIQLGKNFIPVQLLKCVYIFNASYEIHPLSKDHSELVYYFLSAGHIIGFRE